MAQDKYRKALSKKELSTRAIDQLLDAMRTHLTVKPLTSSYLKAKDVDCRITAPLKHLPMYLATGHKSWNGLVLGFPGLKTELSTSNVGTPFLREILYPALDLHKRLRQAHNEKMPCIYLLSERFSDVFLRKFRLLKSITPHVIVLTGDLYRSLISGGINDLSHQDKINEAWIQSYLCNQMKTEEGFNLPLSTGLLKARYLMHELPTGEGTKNPERLDILCADKNDKSLIAFEIKGPQCSRVQFENLFLQGLEHRNWVENNKMAIKFLVEGPGAARVKVVVT